MPQPRAYTITALATFFAVSVLTLTKAGFLQTLLDAALYRISDLFKGLPLPVLLGFYRDHFFNGEAGLVTVLPCLLFGLYLQALSRFTTFTPARYAQLALGAIVSCALTLSFVFVTVAACISPFTNFGGMQRDADYHAPLFDQALTATFLLLLLGNIVFLILIFLRRRQPAA